ncbi:hypothetical protein RR46_00007 [Papilio xuthus]|uniref:Uncharacterized protein n=1 Tax=Papilio xuthus TaxID=66420 RepID=A0A0N1IKG7_PAPXU|nr:hypothetical protein RR46_00007 [Papilio xuthus]
MRPQWGAASVGATQRRHRAMQVRDEESDLLQLIMMGKIDGKSAVDEERNRGCEISRNGRMLPAWNIYFAWHKIGESSLS